MKRVVFSLLLVLAFSTFVSAQVEYIRFALPADESSANLYNLEPYYFLHYFYTDVLYFFDLVDTLDLPTKALLFEKIFNNLNEDYPVGLFIKIAGWDEPLRVSYRVFTDEAVPFIFMVTNYDLKNHEIRAEYSEHCYARLYFLFGDKVVNNLKLFSEEKAEENKANLNNLADLYIFDERDENDHLIEDLLVEHIASTDSQFSKFVGHLTFAQYYLITNELEKAEESLAEAGVLFDNYLEEEVKKNWGLPFIITKEEAQIVAQVRGALPPGEKGHDDGE